MGMDLTAFDTSEASLALSRDGAVSMSMASEASRPSMSPDAICLVAFSMYLVGSVSFSILVCKSDISSRSLDSWLSSPICGSACSEDRSMVDACATSGCLALSSFLAAISGMRSAIGLASSSGEAVLESFARSPMVSPLDPTLVFAMLSFNCVARFFKALANPPVITCAIMRSFGIRVLQRKEASRRTARPCRHSIS